jgi:hypothetical protein
MTKFRSDFPGKASLQTCKPGSPGLFFAGKQRNRPSGVREPVSVGVSQKHPLLKVEIGSKASIVTKVIMLQEKQ